MRTYYCALITIFGWVSYTPVFSQEELVTNNGLSRGLWGDVDRCAQGFTFAINFKFEAPGAIDNTAGNSVQMLCHMGDGQLTDSITSFEGRYGDWQGVRTCPSNGNITGFRARILAEQGAFSDDTGVDNVQAMCADGSVLDGMEGVIPPGKGSSLVDIENPEDDNVIRQQIDINGQTIEVLRLRQIAMKGSKINGEWGTWAQCTTGSVAAIRTRVEEGDPLQDDAGLTDISMYCYT